MARNSILGGANVPARPKGDDVDALGPSDSSDSGSDVQGERPISTAPDNPGELGALPVDGDGDSDAAGTGERGSATGTDAGDNADILPDRVGTDPAFVSQVDERRNASTEADVSVDDLAQDEDGDGGDGGGD